MTSKDSTEMQNFFHSSLLAGMLLLWASEMALHATLSAPVRIDLRTTTGAQIITGTERVSPVANEAEKKVSRPILRHIP